MNELNENIQRQDGVTNMGALYKALAEAQAEMQNPIFDSINPHFKNKYASLAAVRNAVIPVLSMHGIGLIQDVRMDEGKVACYATLTHASGSCLKIGPLSLPVSKMDAQGVGSAITYARRYQLQAISGVVGDEDDDANEADKVGGENRVEMVSAIQIKEIENALREFGKSAAVMCRFAKVRSIDQIPAAKYDAIMAAIKAKPNEDPTETQRPELINDDQAKEIRALIKSINRTEAGFIKWLRENLKVNSIEEIRKDRYEAVREEIEARIQTTGARS